MVPSGWKKGLVSDLADTVMGYAFKSSDFVKKGIPLVRMGNLYQNQFQLDRSPIYLPDDFATEYKRFLLQSGDLVMSMTGTMGKRDYGFAVEIPENTQDCLLNQRVLKIEPRNSDAKGFVLNVLKSEIFLSKLYSLPGGTKQANLSATQIREISVLIPPLPEQQKIAKILSTWDKAISTTERLIENSIQQKKALMQQLLTSKKRLLDESGQRFEGEWEDMELGDVCSRVMEKNNGQSTNVVTISAQQGLIRQEEFFKKSVASELLDNYFVLRKGQFAYNKSYSNGYPMGAIKRLNRYDDGVVTTLYICFEIKDHSETDTDFLEQYFDSGLLNRGLTQVAAEGGRAHGLLNVKPSDFMELKFKLPTYSEQQKIATVLTNADREIKLLEQQLADLQQEKKALMQVLLTGKRRVVVDGEVA